jgi:hypothetical protein
VTTFQDCSVGWSIESTYKTRVAPAIHAEFIDENLDWKKTIVGGKGLRVSSRVDRSTRRVYSRGMGDGDIVMQVASKGLGKLWQAAVGSGVSNVVTGATYQQLFTLGDTPNSLTIQKGVPEVGGTVDAIDFLGCMVEEWDVNSPNGQDLTCKFIFDIGDYSTAQTYVAPVYPSAPSVFNWGQGAVSVGGTLTAPTTTTLASSASPLAGSIRDFNLQVKNNLAGDRFNYGASGRKSKPTVGMRMITGDFTAEYDATNFRDTFLADTQVPIIVTFTGTTALSTGFEQFQIVLPSVALETSMPNSNAGGLITVKHSFTGYDNTVAAQPLWVIFRTSDTAL